MVKVVLFLIYPYYICSRYEQYVVLINAFFR